jgi:hypothetical protein
MPKRILVFLALLVSLSLLASAQRRVPTVDDLINVKSLGGAQISPDGNWVAYTKPIGSRMPLSRTSGWSTRRAASRSN